MHICLFGRRDRGTHHNSIEPSAGANPWATPWPIRPALVQSYSDYFFNPLIVLLDGNCAIAAATVAATAQSW